MQLSKKMTNIAGLRFGSLTAIKPIRLSQQGSVIWEYFCVCGNTHTAVSTAIKQCAKLATNPAVPSCGCIRDARAVETNTTHGYARHPLYVVWQAMHQRCYNPDHKEFSNYGGAGIAVCSEWHIAESFIAWALNNGWEKGLHLDKDVLSDSLGVARVYSPNTCRFICAAQNVGYSGSRRNYAHNKKIKLTPVAVLEIKELAQNEELTQRDIAKMYSVSQAAIWRAIHESI